MSDEHLLRFHERYPRLGRIATVGYWEWDDNTNTLVAVSFQFALLTGRTHEALLNAP